MRCRRRLADASPLWYLSDSVVDGMMHGLMSAKIRRLSASEGRDLISPW
jgi:hypothetical protein